MAINALVLSRISYLRRNSPLCFRVYERFCTNDSAVSVEYPPILDMNNDAKKIRHEAEWHKKIKTLATVEEKLFELNMPSYYGWRCLQLKEDLIPYDSLRFTQFITRTHLIECDDLPPNNGKENDVECSDLMNDLSPLLRDVLMFEFCHKRLSADNEDELRLSLIKQITWLLMSFLPNKVPHLAEVQVDYNPRIEAFWIVGGMEPTYGTWKARKKNKWASYKADYPEDRKIQYVGSPTLQIRHPLPLRPIIDLIDSENAGLEVPYFKYDPRVHGLSVQRRHGTCIPGFWPGDPCEFGLVSFHGRSHMKKRPHWYGPAEHAEALHCQAILASFGWIYPLACYQGFSTFNDVTYPLVTQTVITDGQFWSFYKYQLNTTLVHSNNSTDNPRRNICWGTPAMKLYEKVEDGKIVGLNEDVLKKLVQLYLNKPQKMDVEMKPYLSKHQHVAKIPDEKKREWLESHFKHLYSLRPRSRELPEIYQWEKIYKIDHKMRPMEARRRPFELGINPYKRRLDDQKPAYIPKKFREHKRKKRADTYFP